MRIKIITAENSVDYYIKDLKGSSNDEICRAIAFLEIIKHELINFNAVNFDYEVTE